MNHTTPYPLYDSPKIADLRELIAQDRERFPDVAAFAFMRDGKKAGVTYAQVDADIRALGTCFLARGLNRAKIAVIGENSYEWILVFLAAMNTGNIAVPIDRGLSPAEIRSLLDRTQPSLIAYADTLGDEQKTVFGSTASVSLQTGLPALLEEGRAALARSDHSFDDVRLDPDALAAIIFTSGTTSLPKGVMLSHRNIATNMSAAWGNIHVEGSMMLVLPLHHTFALVAGVLAPMLNGMTVQINSGLRQVLPELAIFQPTTMCVVPLFLENFDRQIWKTIEKSGRTRLVTFMIGVTGFLARIGIDVRRKVFHDVLDAFGGKLSVIISGGAPIDFALINRMRAFGFMILNGYGISECSPIIAGSRNYYWRDGSAGPALYCNEVTIDNPGPDGIGEICARGTNVMLGYYEDEAATAQVMEDGWFHTGDLGKVDDGGFVWITGRLKNLIITSNGENVSAEELEELVGRLPLVEEVLVYQKDGAITAEIFPSEEARTSMSADELAKALREAVNELNRSQPMHKRVKEITVRDTEFEKTTSMKIKRYGGANRD